MSECEYCQAPHQEGCPKLQTGAFQRVALRYWQDGKTSVDTGHYQLPAPNNELFRRSRQLGVEAHRRELERRSEPQGISA